MRIRFFFASVAVVASAATLACDPRQAPVAPNFSISSGWDVSYRVQAFTSFNGQFWNAPNCLDTRYIVLHHDIPGPSIHVDSIPYYWVTCPSGPSGPWNGGWVDIYEVRADGDHYIGQVYGDLVWKDVYYAGPDLVQIKLKAFPDLTYPGASCQFLYFDGYPAGQDSIVVTGQGDLPLAQFYCSS